MFQLKNFRKAIVCFLCCIACLFSISSVSALSANSIPNSITSVPMAPGVSLDNLATASEGHLVSVVHRTASYGSTVIGNLENGTKVTVLGTKGSFYKIDCYDMTGYIAKHQVALRLDGTLYIRCVPSSAETQVLYYRTMAEAMSLRHSLAALGKRYLGVPYVYGGMSPWGFDCSGYTKYIYDMHGISLTRRASTQLGDGLVVSRESLQVGDLIFLKYAYESCEASHVGIYAGNNKVLHASSSRGIVLDSMDSSFISSNYLCARRIVCTEAVTVEVATAAPSILSRTRTMGLRTID